MRLHKTGHPIADTVSDLIGELPDGDYRAAYGILRHNLFSGSTAWFEVDRGFWGAIHFSGLYRLSFRSTQPRYHENGPRKPHGLDLEPWRSQTGPALICPPTSHVSQFFAIDQTQWLMNAIRQANGPYIVRYKGSESPVEWDSISKVITFNSTIAIQALVKGIPVISDPIHSTVGSFTSEIKMFDKYNRNVLFEFISAHLFKLDDKRTIWNLIEYYLSTSDGTQEKQ